MRKIACLLAAIYVCGGQTALADQFAKIQCGGDIPKALIGQRGANERVVVLEARNRKIDLKHLGADEISNTLSSINYTICGSEFMLLEDNKNVVRDVIPFPPHSKKAPAFSSYCEVNGKKAPDVYVGVLDIAQAGELVPALSAWKIDQKQVKFVKASLDGLRCPRDAIYTVDGGR